MACLNYYLYSYFWQHICSETYFRDGATTAVARWVLLATAAGLTGEEGRGKVVHLEHKSIS